MQDMAEKNPCLVMLCDVVDYSRLEPRDQIAVVKLIWDTVLREAGALYDNDPKITAMWGTGDGLYLTTTNDSIDQKLALCYFCRQLIKAVQLTNRDLRAALHVGTVHRVPVSKKRTEMSGPALNECARIVQYAADGQLVMSEEFIRSILDSPRSDAVRFKLTLNPHPDRGAFRATVKHGVIMSIRFDSTQDSHKVANLSMCGQAIDAELADIVEWLCTDRLQMPVKDLGPRITIFRPDRNEFGKVYSFTGTPYRYDPMLGSETPELSRSIYPVNPPQGIAMAFVDRAPRHAAHLPDPRINPEQYFDEVESKWSVPKHVAIDWGRKARSFFAIPLFAYGARGEKPLAMICVDLEHPLDQLGDVELDELADELVMIASLRLGPLWKCLG